MLRPESQSSPAVYPVVAVQGCSRANCDCEVHDRRHQSGRNLTPTENVKIYRDTAREAAIIDYRRRFPKARKVITALCDEVAST